MSQVTTVTLYGTVSDPTDAAVDGAVVAARNENTGARFQAAANSTGEFTLSLLPPGRYTILVEKAGFRPVEQAGLELRAGDQARLRYRLELGEVSQAVGVSAEAPLLNAVNAEQRITLDGAKIRELPVQRRDWTSVLRLGTGIAVGGRSDNSVALNGLAPSGFRFTIDGTNATSDQEYPAMAMDGGFNIVKGVSLEAIAEVSSAKGIASAEIAGTLSGNVNVMTKSGTNDFHGSAFWNNQLENYNARNPFLAAKPGATFNQYGGSFGGPVLRNRLFFFGAYEGYEQRSFQAVSGAVPTPEFRARALAAQPVYKPVFDLLPNPTTAYAPTAVNAQFFGASSQSAADNHATVRVDWNATPRDLLSFRYTRGRPDQISPRFITANPRPFLGAMESGTLSYTRLLGGAVAVTRFGYNYNRSLRVDNRYNLGLANISGAIGFSAQNGETFFKEGNVSSLEQTFAWNRGRHSVKSGFIFQRQAGGRDNIDLPNYNYATIDDFLANIPSQVTMTFGVQLYQLRTVELGGFIQDDWKIRRNLILSYGLRYDIFTVPTERDGRVFNRDAPFGFGPLRPPDQMYNPDRNNYAPRVSLAWTLDPAGNTVIRTGAGYFYSAHTLFGGPLETVLTALDEPFRVQFSRADALRLGIRYPVTLAQALPLVKSSPSVWANTNIDPFFPNPSSIQWLFSVARQMGGATSVEAAYVGNRGVRLNMVRQMNLVDRVTGVRPVQGFGEFRYYDPSDSSSYNSLQLSLKRRLRQGFLANANYTWARNLSYSDGDLLLSDRPQDNNNIRLDRGPTGFERRHVFLLDALYDLPFARWTGAQRNAAGRLLLDGWQLSGIWQARSGSAANLTQNSTYPSARVDYVGGEAYRDNWRETLVYLNPAAFQQIPIVRASGAHERNGNVGRNAIRNPGNWTVDLSLAKSFSIREGMRAQLRIDMFNALNRPTFGGLQTSINSSNFGRLTSAGARSMQLHFRFSF